MALLYYAPLVAPTTKMSISVPAITAKKPKRNL